MKTLKNNKGLISILAVVVTVIVGGGTIFYGSKILHDNYSKECGDMLDKWNSGQALAELADSDNLDIIDHSIKCQKAVYDTIKIAKPVSSIMSASTNVGGNAQNLASVIVDRMMDGVENLSKEVPSLKDKPLPDDVENKKNEKEGEKASKKVDEFLNNMENELIEIKDEGEAEASSDNASDSEAGEKSEINDCALGYTDDSSPRLKFDCPDGVNPGQTAFIQTHFSDPEGDYKEMYIRTKVQISQYNGSQKGQWIKVSFNEAGKCGSSKKTEVSIPEDLGLSNVSAIFGIEAYLTDAEGHKSEVESCDLVEY